METTRDRILHFLSCKGISKSQFYAETGLSNGFLDKTINPGADKLDKILTAYPEINLYFLVSGKGDMIVKEETAPNAAPIIAPNDRNSNIIQLTPRVITVDKNNVELIALVPAKAAAGYLNGFSDPEYIESLPSIVLPGMAGLSHRAFEVRGQSMLPTHHSGSIAIGRAVEAFSDIRDRRVYIIVTKADGIVLKRVLNRIKEDGKLILMSDNDNKREYPNYPLDAEDILEMWYWRGSIIRESPEPGGMYARINDLEAKLTLQQTYLNQLISPNKERLNG